MRRACKSSTGSTTDRPSDRPAGWLGSRMGSRWGPGLLRVASFPSPRPPVSKLGQMQLPTPVRGQPAVRGRPAVRRRDRPASCLQVRPWPRAVSRPEHRIDHGSPPDRPAGWLGSKVGVQVGSKAAPRTLTSGLAESPQAKRKVWDGVPTPARPVEVGELHTEQLPVMEGVVLEKNGWALANH